VVRGATKTVSPAIVEGNEIVSSGAAEILKGFTFGGSGRAGSTGRVNTGLFGSKFLKADFVCSGEVGFEVCKCL